MGYREFAVPPSLRGSVACTWQHRVDRAQLVVPDGCVDLIWLAGRTLIVAGPDTRPHLETLPVGSLTTGIRLRPGAAGSFLGRPADTLRDGRVDASELWRDWPGALADSLAGATPGQARARLRDAVQARDVRPDPLVRRAAALLGGSHRRVADVAAELGVSERQLHRRCLTAVGYGPKFLARVSRLHSLPRTSGQLADRAITAGYANQAHMSEDIRRLTGLTAVRFLKDRGAVAA